MTKRERIRAVLAGEIPDRVPVAFWHHFGPGYEYGPAAVDAHLEHFERYDLDFLKVMNDNAYPREKEFLVRTGDDLRKLRVLGGDEEPFLRQLELVAALRRKLGPEVLIASTVFSPYSVLRQLAGPERRVHNPPKLELGDDERDQVLGLLLRTSGELVHEALLCIAATLSRFTRYCLEAGADGIFFSVRDDWVESALPKPGTYDSIVREADLVVCRSASAGSFNVLHICGRAVDFSVFSAYPVQVINWADRACGPAIREATRVLKPAICAGVDNFTTLVHGTPQDCRAEVLDALGQTGGRPMIIAPGCTYAPEAVPAENLGAICSAAREFHFAEEKQ